MHPGTIFDSDPESHTTRHIMDHKANTPEKQFEKTTDPQDNEIAGNFIGDLIGHPKPAADQAGQVQDGSEQPTQQPLSEEEERRVRGEGRGQTGGNELLPDA